MSDERKPQKRQQQAQGNDDCAPTHPAWTGGKDNRVMRRIAFFAVTAAILTAFPAQAQSLNETFDWMSNTLKQAEGNNYYVHHPFPDRSQKELEDGVDPRTMERITEFSHNGCSVKFEVYLEFDDTNLNGTYSAENDVLTFNLKNLDPQTINVEDSCKPVTPGGGDLLPDFRTRLSMIS